MKETKDMPCPECGFPIPISIEILIAGDIKCRNCLLELKIDQRKSDTAMKEMRKLQDALENVENVRKKYE